MNPIKLRKYIKKAQEMDKKDNNPDNLMAGQFLDLATIRIKGVVVELELLPKDLQQSFFKLYEEGLIELYATLKKDKLEEIAKILELNK